MFRRDFRDFEKFAEARAGMFRAGRGMTEPAILQILVDKPMHGYEIISTFEDKSGGMWRPSPGSIYPTLQLLEEKDYVTCEEEDGKKIYSLTELGKKAADEHKSEFDINMWENHREKMHDRHELHHSLRQSMHTMRKIFRKGSDGQKQQLLALITRFQNDLDHLAKER